MAHIMTGLKDEHLNAVCWCLLMMPQANYSIFDKFSQLNWREIVENKRLGSVLAHIQQQHEELEQQNKRNRSQSKKTVIQQRNLNPVLDLKMPV